MEIKQKAAYFTIFNLQLIRIDKILYKGIDQLVKTDLVEQAFFITDHDIILCFISLV